MRRWAARVSPTWQVARELIGAVYWATAKAQFAKEFGLRDQIRGASVSVVGNIAEGHERDGTREFLEYLSVAKASAPEAESHRLPHLGRRVAVRYSCAVLRRR